MAWCPSKRDGRDKPGHDDSDIKRNRFGVAKEPSGKEKAGRMARLFMFARMLCIIAFS
jgi:hypothetical protein